MSIDKSTLDNGNEWKDYIEALNDLDQFEPGSDQAIAATEIAETLGAAARERAQKTSIVRPDVKRGLYVSPKQQRAIRR